MGEAWRVGTGRVSRDSVVWRVDPGLEGWGCVVTVVSFDAVRGVNRLRVFPCDLSGNVLSVDELGSGVFPMGVGGHGELMGVLGYGVVSGHRLLLLLMLAERKWKWE